MKYAEDLAMCKKNNRTLLQIITDSMEQNVQIDKRTSVYLTPKRIVWQKGWVKNAEVLLEKRDMQISLEAHNPCILKNENRNKASLLLDFGVEIHGGIRIFSWADSTGKGAKVRIRFGESVSEAMSELGGKSNATNDHARRDMVTEIGMMSMNPVGETGFRFVRIDLEEDNAEILLKSIVGVLVYKDVPYRGSFMCNDPLLNRIWNVGAYTIHLNMQEYIWDGIKRDRLVWVGDMHPEVATILAVFGADDSVEKSLDFIREETPLPGWMNHMATYSMWYAIILYDWYMHTGHRSFLDKQKEYLVGILEQLSTHINQNGQDTVTEGRFMDWPSYGQKEIVDAGVQSIHILATVSLKNIFRVLEDEKRVSQCEKDLKKLKKYQVDYQDSKAAAALTVLANLKDARIVNEEVLSKGGSNGFSTFMGYYILQAMAEADNDTQALSCIREYWGGMLALGATTFWEDFDISWMNNAAKIDEIPKEGQIDVHGTYGDYCYRGYRHSLCHGWASGVTAWLSETVLGVQILEAGCKKIKLKPHLGDLEFAKGTYPTPYGNIFVSHEKKKDGTIETKWEAPKEVEIVFA